LEIDRPNEAAVPLQASIGELELGCHNTPVDPQQRNTNYTTSQNKYVFAELNTIKHGAHRKQLIQVDSR